MLFGCSKGNGSRLVALYLTIVSCVNIACHTTSLYHSFSYRYSMSYDISISLLKKNLCKHFSKSSREGGTHFQEKSRWSIKHDHLPLGIWSITHDHFHSFGSTLQVLQTISVPWQYPPSTPSGTFLRFSENTFVKPKLDIGLGNN
jgi:hypothetical protein